MKASTLARASVSLAALMSASLFAYGHDLGAILAGKRQAEISYREVMHVLQHGAKMALDGLFYENPELVALGADLITNHPAPQGGPLAAFVPEKREELRRALPSYNARLREITNQLKEEAARRDWVKAAERFQELTALCAECHASWRGYAINRTDKSARPSVQPAY